MNSKSIETSESRSDSIHLTSNKYFNILKRNMMALVVKFRIDVNKTKLEIRD